MVRPSIDKSRKFHHLGPNGNSCYVCGMTRADVGAEAMLADCPGIQLADLPPAPPPMPIEKLTDAFLSITENHGVKHDEDKIRLDLVPPEALEEIAKALAFGASKYTDHNWRKGFIWSRVSAALLRHMYAWLKKEDSDPESGLSHLSHVGACVMFLLTYEVTKTGTDDRFTKP